MSLRGLILLCVVDEHFEAPIESAMVEVEAKAAHFDRFAASFMLTDIDAGIELVEDLVITREQRLVENGSVSIVN
jgi:hypothetical protein